MGLINWIKTKYYDSLLKKADKLALENRLDEAEETYKEILGKQDLAIVNLAEMLVHHAHNVSEKLTVLKKLEDIKYYETPENATEFDHQFTLHLNGMENTAEIKFKNGNYKESVQLIDAIRKYHNTKSSFLLKVHKYHAYWAFDKSETTSSYKVLFDEVISHLKEYNQSCYADLIYFIDKLKAKKKYVRALYLMLPFTGVFKEIKEDATECIIKIVSSEDNELKKPIKISEFCNDKKLCEDAAAELVKRSLEHAKKKEYKTAVLFDGFAAEFFDNDNVFNNNRCCHILEELSTRADANEIKKLLDFASSLHLSSEQINSLKIRISEIANDATPEKSIPICRLFLDDQTFDSIYLKQSAIQAKANKGEEINAQELLSVIKKNSTDETFVDALIPFVNYISEYEDIYLKSAISKILRHQSTSMLEKYWKVKKSIVFFEQLIVKSNPGYKEIVAFIVNKHSVFLCTEDLRMSFCKSIDSLNDNNYACIITENLLSKKCDVKEYYVKVAAIEAIGKHSNEEAIDSINHAISILNDQRLIDKKKLIIRELIDDKKYSVAEKESESLLGIDAEAATLLAETYYSLWQDSDNISSKKAYLFKILDVCENKDVFSSFNEKKDQTLLECMNLLNDSDSDKDKKEAYLIAERIINYPSYWIPFYISLREKDYEKLKTLGQRIAFIKETINKVTSSCPEINSTENNCYLDLWEKYKNLLVEKTSAQPKDKAIQSLKDLCEQLKTFCIPTFFTQHVQDLTKRIVKLEWALALEFEHDLAYNDAIALYDAIKQENLSTYNGRAELRSLICYVKSNQVDNDIENRIRIALELKSYEALKDDLAYRYTCYLLKNIRSTDAKAILKEYLSDETDLLGLCDNIAVKEAEQNLIAFNQKIRTIADGSMSVIEATNFLAEFENWKSCISNKLTDTSDRFASYKTTVESYILRGLFNEERYLEAFNKMLELFPNFLDDDNQLRNLAIASLGLIEAKCAKDTQIKYAISIWLSAIYTDRLFVKSLDYTSWDDPFTFTLKGSLGKTIENDYDNLPPNINFDNPIDNQIIAIADVQNSLILRLETFIREDYPTLETFFNFEKAALDDLIKLNLDKTYKIVSPYLSAKLPIARQAIKNAFDYEIEQDYDNKEDALNLGVRYEFKGGEYTKFKTTQNLVEICMGSITGSVQNISTAFSNKNISSIKNFTKLYSSLKSFVSSRMNESIKAKMDYKKVIDIYEIICKALDDVSLSLTFSNYANAEVIYRLNNKTMNLRDGVRYMVRIFNTSPTNIQVKQNLEGILETLAFQAEQTKNSADISAITQAVKDTGSTFATFVEDTKIRAQLSIIVEKVNSGSMQKSKALNDVYNLYLKDKNNPDICKNLVALCDICIMEYVINNISRATSVRNILDQLCINKSSTFQKNSIPLINRYYEIWNQLPPNIQYAINNPSWSVVSRLNEKGLALKDGLNYYKKLSGQP